MEQRGDTFNRAMDRLRDEMAREKGQQLQLLGEGLTAMLQLHPEWADALLKKNTSIVGALDAVRRGATGGCSDPIQTTKSICGYYGIKCGDPRALALEVAAALAGGSVGATAAAGETTGTSSAPDGAPSPEGKAEEAPDIVDLFDLDALMGGL